MKRRGVGEIKDLTRHIIIRDVTAGNSSRLDMSHNFIQSIRRWVELGWVVACRLRFSNRMASFCRRLGLDLSCEMWLEKRQWWGRLHPGMVVMRGSGSGCRPLNGSSFELVQTQRPCDIRLRWNSMLYDWLIPHLTNIINQGIFNHRILYLILLPTTLDTYIKFDNNNFDLYQQLPIGY